jgi:hypothetical protein
MRNKIISVFSCFAIFEMFRFLIQIWSGINSVFSCSRKFRETRKKINAVLNIRGRRPDGWEPLVYPTHFSKLLLGRRSIQKNEELAFEQKSSVLKTFRKSASHCVLFTFHAIKLQEIGSKAKASANETERLKFK